MSYAYGIAHTIILSTIGIITILWICGYNLSQGSQFCSKVYDTPKLNPQSLFLFYDQFNSFLFFLIMGCANSKQKRCRHCNAPYSPVPRSYSMHVHHPPQTEGDTYHVVALTSTTLGTLKLNSPASNFQQLPSSNVVASNGKVTHSESFRFANENFIEDKDEENEKEKIIEKKEEFSMGLIEAKTWSNMIGQKLPKAVPMTPTRTPPGEPETINTWELMEGLEDTSPFRSPNRCRSFSFDVSGGGGDVDAVDPPKLSNNSNDSPKPLWLHMTEEEARLNPAISDFDPEVIASFRKSLQQLSPESPFHLRRPTPCDEEKQGTKRGFSSCEEKKTKIGGGGGGGGDDDGAVNVVEVKVAPPCGQDKVVLYFTSLRGVRKTYEDCCQVRLILKGLGVKVDERDVSMHSMFKDELKELLGDGYCGGGGGLLPRVFVRRNCIGGAEEIQRLHEDGKLEKVLQCCERVEESVCEACGDIRFVPCETCSGSCKIYYEGDDEEGEAEYDYGEVGECGFQRCPDCNENGLIRCPICCY